MKVMIADDCANIRLLYKILLTHAGHDVISEAENGLETLKSYQYYSPDLLIIDNKMDKMNGIDVVREISRSHCDAKIIMCTANYEEITSEAIKLGVIEIIPKPFEVEYFMEAISKIGLN